MKNYSLVVVLSVFVWAGAVLSISFMEAPLKFQAPGITTELGLGIGRIVFHALNKGEWLLASLLTGGLFFGGGFKIVWWIYGIIFSILIYQTFILLPQLDARAIELLNGNPPKESYHHITYIIIESIKLLGLFLFGIIYLNHKLKHHDTSGSIGTGR